MLKVEYLLEVMTRHQVLLCSLEVVIMHNLLLLCSQVVAVVAVVPQLMLHNLELFQEWVLVVAVAQHPPRLYSQAEASNQKELKTNTTTLTRMEICQHTLVE